MEVSAAESLMSFRQEYRAWLSEHLPSGWDALLYADLESIVAFQRTWLQTLDDAGFAAVDWPVRYGGRGGGLAEQIVILEENARVGAPNPIIFSMSLIHAATTLLAHGSDEQKAEHLPRIRRGDAIWCQGFSEPDAGSDLASLSTRAVFDDEEFVLNGQKTWSSRANIANWCMVLVRTNPTAPKHHGISFLLLDMESQGVEVRPIRQMTGETEFCEIFLEDVRVPAANLVGHVDEGWQVAQTTLSAERGLAMVEYAHELRGALRRFVATMGFEASQYMEQFGRFYAEIEVLVALCEHNLTLSDEHRGNSQVPSIVKLYYSELAQRLFEFLVDITGTEAQLEQPVPSRLVRRDLADSMLSFLRSWSLTISGGTSEIQRNMIAERGLHLPREPRVLTTS